MDPPAADVPRNCLFFWEDDADPDCTGWWLAPSVGSEEYYAVCLGSWAQLPGAEHCRHWEMGNAHGSLAVLSVEAYPTGGSVVVRMANDRSDVGGVYDRNPAAATIPQNSKVKAVLHRRGAAQAAQAVVRRNPVRARACRWRAPVLQRERLHSARVAAAAVCGLYTAAQCLYVDCQLGVSERATRSDLPVDVHPPAHVPPVRALGAAAAAADTHRATRLG